MRNAPVSAVCIYSSLWMRVFGVRHSDSRIFAGNLYEEAWFGGKSGEKTRTCDSPLHLTASPPAQQRDDFNNWWQLQESIRNLYRVSGITSGPGKIHIYAISKCVYLGSWRILVTSDSVNSPPSTSPSLFLPRHSSSHSPSPVLSLQSSNSQIWNRKIAFKNSSEHYYKCQI